MCGRYNVTKKLETIEKELSIEILQRELFETLSNISPGNHAPILKYPEAKKTQAFQFGLTPFWAKKKMYVFNARAEGDHNKENQTNYQGAKGILQKPMFRKPIRSQRCLVIADSFIEGPTQEKLSQPFLIFKNDFSSFTLGGIWDEWEHKETGEIIHSFAIITTAATSITAAVGHHRAPLIIEPENREQWLNPETELNVVSTLLIPFDGKNYNAYPISPKIKNPHYKNIEDLLPTGPAIKKVKETKVVEGLQLLGMGESPARNRRLKEDQGD